jgi:hypothetical protein
MELSFDRRFIVLSYNRSQQRYFAKLESSLQRVIKGWTPTTRISPLFGIKNYRHKTFTFSKNKNKNYIIFIGPIPPSRLHEFIPKRCGLWLSLGLFNVVLQTPKSSDKRTIINWLDSNNFRYELWALEKHKITNIRESKNGLANNSWRDNIAEVAELKVPLQMEDTKSEYCPLISTSLARSSECYPSILSELENVNAIISKLLLSSLDSSLSEQHEANAVLAKTNAGLSRFSSQTFSGTSPITGTECHYWTHSLLGTGMANIALNNIFSFIRDKLGLFNLPARLENIDNCTILPTPFSLVEKSHSDEFWYKDYLKNTPVLSSEESQIVFPLVTYFSGRDGFKSTKTTLSAPLATISACNSRYWDLMTLTHELSHLVIKGFLSSICPNRESNEEVGTAVKLVTNNIPESTWSDSLRKYVLQSILLIHKKDIDGKLSAINTSIMKKILNRWYYEIEEIMAHVFDFLYFYKQDVQHYISGIWSSWSVIPNISNRVEEYVIRTMCSVLSKNLRKGSESENIAYEQVLSSLAEIKNNDPQLPYVSDAILFLKNSWDSDLRNRIIARKSLVALVRSFFYSDYIAAQLFKERHLSGHRSETDGYSKKIGIIDGVKIDNPLRFLKNYTKDQDPSSCKSLWILSNIGFNSEWQ